MNQEIPKIKTPQNVKDLKAIYQQFGAFLTPENRQLLATLIAEMEKGPNDLDKEKLQNLAKQMKEKAQEAQSHIPQ